MWDCKYPPKGGDLQSCMARISWFSAGEASSGPKFKGTCEIAESHIVHPSIWLVSAMVTDMWRMIKTFISRTTEASCCYGGRDKLDRQTDRQTDRQQTDRKKVKGRDKSHFKWKVIPLQWSVVDVMPNLNNMADDLHEPSTLVLDSWAPCHEPWLTSLS